MGQCRSRKCFRRASLELEINLLGRRVRLSEDFCSLEFEGVKAGVQDDGLLKIAVFIDGKALPVHRERITILQYPLDGKILIFGHGDVAGHIGE